MKRHFEICMSPDGRYFFRARTVTGELLAESGRHMTRQAALDALGELLKLCRRDVIACYDQPRHGWYRLDNPEITGPPV